MYVVNKNVEFGKGDTIKFGNIKEKHFEKRGRYLDTRLICTGEPTEYVVLVKNIEGSHTEFELPDDCVFLCMRTNNNVGDTTHLFYAVPVSQYGGGD